MTTRQFALDYQIIDVDFHFSPYLGVDDPIHQPLVCGSCILKPEGHCNIAVCTNFSDEGRFFLIFGVYFDLMKPAEGIEEAKESMLSD